MKLLATRPTPTPSWTGSSTTLTGSNSPAKACAGPETGKPKRLDHTPVLSNMKSRKPASLATRAASFRYGGRHHSGIPGGFMSFYPGGFVVIGNQDRRRRGKNDDLDAQNAAHAAFAGKRTVTPRSRDGMIESLRVLMACRKTAVTARRVALQLIHNTVVCAPDGLRDQLRNMTRMQLIRTLASWRPDLTAYRDLDSAYRIGLKSLARRYLELHDEIADLDAMVAAIVDELAPNLVARNSIGHIGAAQLLLTAGDNPERLRSEASFASLCGVSPVPASSGKTVRHRLNRGGDRAANSALHIIAIGRLRTDQRTKDYVARRIAEGHSKLDAIRALKRYLAREAYTLITQRRREINATRIAA